MKSRLNQTTIPTLAVGNHWDTQDGLLLRVSATCKSWYFYKHNPNTGKPIRRALGKWPNMSVEAARKAARAMQGSLDKGEALAASMTLGALLDLYEKHVKARKIRHPGYAREIFNLNWKDIASRKLSKLTAAELQSAHDDIAIKRGALAAARAIKHLRALFNYAMDQDLAERNPAKKVRVRADTKRDVFLNAHELTVFRKVLATKSQDVQDFFNLLLLTGARRGNVASMRWQDIQDDLWVIPGSASKTGEQIVVPLLPAAQAILARRRDDTPWVFPSVTASAGFLAEPWFWVKEIREDMHKLGVMKHFTIHDLRRTFATMLTAKGVPLTVVSKALGHTNIQTTPTYVRADIETVRRAMLTLT